MPTFDNATSMLKSCHDHVDRDASFLDRSYANRTLAYITELWQHSVHLKTGDEKGQEVFLMVEP